MLAPVQRGMRTHVASIRIAAPASAVTAFTADGAKLTIWAIGFVKAVAPDDERWLVTTASGDRLPLRVVVDEATSVVDYVMEPAPGVEVTAATRAVECRARRARRRPPAGAPHALHP